MNTPERRSLLLAAQRYAKERANRDAYPVIIYENLDDGRMYVRSADQDKPEGARILELEQVDPD